jgi:hypothetical protein
MNTMRDLLAPSLSPIIRRIRLWLVERDIRDLYRQLELTSEQVRDGKDAIRWLDREISKTELKRNLL